MSSDGWKVVWFGVFCGVVILVAWGAMSYLSSSTATPTPTPATAPATQGAVTR